MNGFIIRCSHVHIVAVSLIDMMPPPAFWHMPGMPVPDWVKSWNKPFPYDCNVIRKRIAAEVGRLGTQKRLLDLLCVNSNSMNRFLTKKGAREGQDSEVYAKAKQYFMDIDR